MSKIRNGIEGMFDDFSWIHDKICPDTSVVRGAAAVARQAVAATSDQENKHDNFHLQDKTSYSIDVVCCDGSVKEIIPKHTSVPGKGRNPIRAQTDKKCVSLSICEGDSYYAEDNRIIGSFFMDESTLHREGAWFHMHWDVDENFEVEFSGLDKIRVRELQTRNKDVSELKRGVRLTLTSFNPNQVAESTRAITKMTQRQDFNVKRSALVMELNRLQQFLEKCPGHEKDSNVN